MHRLTVEGFKFLFQKREKERKKGIKEERKGKKEGRKERKGKKEGERKKRKKEGKKENIGLSQTHFLLNIKCKRKFLKAHRLIQFWQDFSG